MSRRTRIFKVEVPRLADVSEADWKEYIHDAVGCWRGQFHPEHPLFDLDYDEVKVARSVERAGAAQHTEYKAWYDEAMAASNEAGFAGVSAAEAIRQLAAELQTLKASLAGDDAAKALLTGAEIANGWQSTFSTGNPFCPCDLKTFTKAARWAESAISHRAAPELHHSFFENN